MTPPILLSAEVIHQRIHELAADLSRDYADAQQLHFICVLKGAFVFLADLVRAVDKPTTIDFLAVSSYAKGTTSTGEVRLLKDLDAALNGRHVLIVEDIVDTGLTLQYLQEILRARGPKSLAVDHDIPSHGGLRSCHAARLCGRGDADRSASVGGIPGHSVMTTT